MLKTYFFKLPIILFLILLNNNAFAQIGIHTINSESSFHIEIDNSTTLKILM